MVLSGFQGVDGDSVIRQTDEMAAFKTVEMDLYNTVRLKSHFVTMYLDIGSLWSF